MLIKLGNGRADVPNVRRTNIEHSTNISECTRGVAHRDEDISDASGIHARRSGGRRETGEENGRKRIIDKYCIVRHLSFRDI